MSMLAKIFNSVITRIANAPGNSIQVDIETAGRNQDDAEIYHLPGIFSNPIDGISGVVVSAGGNNIIIATHDYKLNKTLDKGETLIYSIDADSNVLASVLLNKDGDFIVNDGTRSAVGFAELKTGFDELKEDFNNHITAYNLHVHPDPVSGNTGATTSISTESTASIDDSESETVKIP